MTDVIVSSPARRMPTLFVPHGAGPCFFMDWNPPTAWNAMADFLKGVAATLPARPRAILMVSAHWLQPAFSVTGAARPELIYDYSGFPAHTTSCAIRRRASRNWRRAWRRCSARRRWRMSRTRSAASTMACSSR